MYHHHTYGSLQVTVFEEKSFTFYFILVQPPCF